jgi:hypothetical protein
MLRDTPASADTLVRFRCCLSVDVLGLILIHNRQPAREERSILHSRLSAVFVRCVLMNSCCCSVEYCLFEKQ